MPLNQIAEGMRDLNQKMFSPEQVKGAGSCLPSKDDMANLDHFIKDGGDVNKLPLGDKFAVELLRIPDIAQRLQAFNFKLSFDPKKADIKPGIEIIKQASKELKESSNLVQLMEFVLEVGNFINEGTPRGGVLGFKLTSLNKIADTKSTDNTTSLLHYIAKVLSKESPKLLHLEEELPNCEKAARVSLSQLIADKAALAKDYRTMDEMLKTYEEKDKFTDIMTSFLATAKVDLEQLDTSIKITEDKYSEVVTYFGEDPKTMAPDEFFGGFTKFFDSLREAAKQNDAAEQNAEKEKRREEAKNKRQAEMDTKKKGPGPGNDSVVDELFGVLKGGNYFKSQRQQRQSVVADPPKGPPQNPPPQLPKVQLKKTT